MVTVFPELFLDFRLGDSVTVGIISLVPDAAILGSLMELFIIASLSDTFCWVASEVVAKPMFSFEIC